MQIDGSVRGARQCLNAVDEARTFERMRPEDAIDVPVGLAEMRRVPEDHVVRLFGRETGSNAPVVSGHTRSPRARAGLAMPTTTSDRRSLASSCRESEPIEPLLDSTADDTERGARHLCRASCDAPALGPDDFVR